MSGKTVGRQTEVKLVTSEGVYLAIENVGYFASFAAFPYLADLTSGQIFNVQYCGHGHIRWEEADIDLHTKILAHPEEFPVRMQTISAAASEMGRRGGSVKSDRKSVSSAANGLKGGRPSKSKMAVLT